MQRAGVSQHATTLKAQMASKKARASAPAAAEAPASGSAPALMTCALNAVLASNGVSVAIVIYRVLTSPGDHTMELLNRIIAEVRRSPPPDCLRCVRCVP